MDIPFHQQGAHRIQAAGSVPLWDERGATPGFGRERALAMSGFQSLANPLHVGFDAFDVRIGTVRVGIIQKPVETAEIGFELRLHKFFPKIRVLLISSSAFEYFETKCVWSPVKRAASANSEYNTGSLST